MNQIILIVLLCLLLVLLFLGISAIEVYCIWNWLVVSNFKDTTTITWRQAFTIGIGVAYLNGGLLSGFTNSKN